MLCAVRVGQGSVTARSPLRRSSVRSLPIRRFSGSRGSAGSLGDWCDSRADWISESLDVGGREERRDEQSATILTARHFRSRVCRERVATAPQIGTLNASRGRAIAQRRVPSCSLSRSQTNSRPRPPRAG